MKLFKLLFVLLPIFILFTSCQEDLLPSISEAEEIRNKQSVIGMEDDAYFSLVSEFNSFSNGRITENIDFDDALRTFDESGEAKYSVEIPNENIHLTQNLIIGRDSLGTPYGFVFEYEADTSWVSENDNVCASFCVFCFGSKWRC